MSPRGDVFACFDDDWPGVAEHGFEGTDGWALLGEVPGGAAVKEHLPHVAAVEHPAQ